jgi:hypothetical protein
MGCARLVRPPGGQEANPGAVQPGHDPVDDDRDRDGRKHECAQDRPGVPLVLGDQDLVLGVGEAAEPDTRPHWLGSTGDGLAEVLTIFGRPGERMQVRSAGGDEPQPHQDPHD